MDTNLIRRPMEASTEDYLIRAFFEIVGKDDPVYRDHQVRLNNLVFNNVKQITDCLINRIFTPKTVEITDEILSLTTHISIVTHYDPRMEKCPVFAQFFDRNHGIRRIFLDYTDETKSVLRIVVDRHLLHKIEAFCGDFSAINAKTPTDSDRFKNLNFLQEGKLKNYPLQDGILERLFTLLASYMDHDPVDFLLRFGDYLMGGCQTERILRKIQELYALYLNQGRYVLDSDYARYVLANFPAVCATLETQTCIPKPVGEFANDPITDFVLVFTMEMYANLKKCPPRGEGAVCYYFRLTDMVKGLVLMKEQLFVPLECHKFDVFPHKSVSAFYERACVFLDRIIGKFEGAFECCRWLLLEKAPDCAEIEVCFWKFMKSSALGIGNEVARLKEILAIHDITGKVNNANIDQLWVHILGMCQNERVEIPRISSLVEYLFCLPSSYENALKQTGQNPKKFTYNDKLFIKHNLLITGASLKTQGIEGFITDFEAAECIIKELRVPMFEE